MNEEEEEENINKHTHTNGGEREKRKAEMKYVNETFFLFSVNYVVFSCRVEDVRRLYCRNNPMPNDFQWNRVVMENHKNKDDKYY